MGLRALIFDMDGLLLDTEKLALETWTEASRQMGFDLSEETVRGTIGLDHVLSRAYYHRLFGDRYPYSAVEILNRDLFRTRIQAEGVPVKPGVREILAEAHRLGLKVALGTSSRSVYVHAVLWLAGIVDQFHTLVTRDLVQAGKPAPDIYLKATATLGIPAEDCLVFEDSRSGILAASAAGIPVIMIPDLIEPTDELRSLCLTVQPSLLDAADLLEGMTQASIAC